MLEKQSQNNLSAISIDVPHAFSNCISDLEREFCSLEFLPEQLCMLPGNSSFTTTQ